MHFTRKPKPSAVPTALAGETPVSISQMQLKAFTKIFKMNTRPLQELHGRRILANE